jgi:hypothetical protein
LIAGNLALKAFYQGHEIPHRKDVYLHEFTQSVQRVDLGVNGMFEQGLSKRRDGSAQLFETALRVSARAFCNGASARDS